MMFEFSPIKPCPGTGPQSAVDSPSLVGAYAGSVVLPVESVRTGYVSQSVPASASSEVVVSPGVLAMEPRHQASVRPFPAADPMSAAGWQSELPGNSVTVSEVTPSGLKVGCD